MSQKKLQFIYESILHEQTLEERIATDAGKIVGGLGRGVRQLVGPRHLSQRLGMAARQALKDITGFDPADPAGQGTDTKKKKSGSIGITSPSTTKNVYIHVSTKPLKTTQILPKKPIYKSALIDIGIPEDVLNKLKHGKIKRLSISDRSDESANITFKNGEYYVVNTTYTGNKEPKNPKTAEELKKG